VELEVDEVRKSVSWCEDGWSSGSSGLCTAASIVKASTAATKSVKRRLPPDRRSSAPPCHRGADGATLRPSIRADLVGSGSGSERGTRKDGMRRGIWLRLTRVGRQHWWGWEWEGSGWPQTDACRHGSELRFFLFFF
jgi:hypothetical protein